MKQLFSSGIVIVDTIDRKREYLLLHYRANHWDLAKGKIEKGETKEQAALRELEEETGLHAQLFPDFQETFGYWFRDHQDGELSHKTVYLLVGIAHGKEIRLSEEHIGFIWLPFEQALERLSYDNAREVVKKAELFLNTLSHDS